MSISLSEGLFLFLLPISVMAIDIWLWQIRGDQTQAYAQMHDARIMRREKKSGDVKARYHQLLRVVKVRRKLMLVVAILAFIWLLLLKSFEVIFFWGDLYFLSLVLGLMIFDARFYLLPDPAVYLLLWGGIFYSLLPISPQILEKAVWGVIASYLVMFTLYVIGRIYYRQEVIGRGDLKFSAAIGAWIGVDYIDYFLLGSALIGIFGAMFLFLKNARNLQSAIPFGPSLGFSGIILYFIARIMTVLTS